MAGRLIPFVLSERPVYSACFCSVSSLEFCLPWPTGKSSWQRKIGRCWVPGVSEVTFFLNLVTGDGLVCGSMPTSTMDAVTPAALLIMIFSPKKKTS